jgi:hypothetical protein
MEPLDDFIDESQRCDRPTFVRSHAYPFLVITVPEEAGDGWRAFRTTHFTQKQVHTPLPPSAAEYRLLRVVKTSRNPWVDRISIGRASNNDLVVRDPSVSKLHAHLRMEPSRVTVADAGSRNGTSVNGRPLRELEAVQLVSGDELQFGKVNMTFQDAAALFDFLRRLT